MFDADRDQAAMPLRLGANGGRRRIRMQRFFVLLAAAAAVLTLGVAAALADLDCDSRQVNGRNYAICLTPDGDQICFVCTTPYRIGGSLGDCRPADCP
jgi:hypothetical protein